MLHKIKLMPVSEKAVKAGHIPKFTIMVFPKMGSAVKQTPELIEKLNEALKDSAFDIPTDVPAPRLDQMSFDMQ